MAFDGNGNYVRSFSWTADKANSIDITASRMDTEDNGVAAGLTLAVTRDGQGKMAAPFLPNADAAYDLGSVSERWGNLYLAAMRTSGTQILGLGPVAAALLDMTPDKGSWPTALSGPWIAGNNPTGTLKWSRQGSQVTLYADSSITQTATTPANISASALPAAIIPSATRHVTCIALENAGTQVYGDVAILSSGLINISVAGVSGSVLVPTSFSSGGLAGIMANWSITYSL